MPIVTLGVLFMFNLPQIESIVVGRPIRGIREEEYGRLVIDFGDGLTLAIHGEYDSRWEPGLGMNLVQRHPLKDISLPQPDQVCDVEALMAWKD